MCGRSPFRFGPEQRAARLLRQDDPFVLPGRHVLRRVHGEAVEVVVGGGAEEVLAVHVERVADLDDAAAVRVTRLPSVSLKPMPGGFGGAIGVAVTGSVKVPISEPAATVQLPPPVPVAPPVLVPPVPVAPPVALPPAAGALRRCLWRPRRRPSPSCRRSRSCRRSPCRRCRSGPSPRRHRDRRLSRRSRCCRRCRRCRPWRRTFRRSCWCRRRPGCRPCRCHRRSPWRHPSGWRRQILWSRCCRRFRRRRRCPRRRRPTRCYRRAAPSKRTTGSISRPASVGSWGRLSKRTLRIPFDADASSGDTNSVIRCGSARSK